MQPFTTHTGIVATLDRANVDTDAIIPKQFLKSIKRTGYGPNAFFDWRYTPSGDLNPEFELNQSRFQGRSVDERFEDTAGLTPGLSDAVKLAGPVISPANHRKGVAILRIDGNQAGLYSSRGNRFFG